MIGLCTDSGAPLPPELADRFHAEVVPVTVTVDGCERLDGVDLCPDELYELMGPDGSGRVSVTRPSPGQFALAYDHLIERGCTEILSVHAGDVVTGTIAAARMAARQLPIRVRVVDTHSAGFGAGACVWAAGRAIALGASMVAAEGSAEAISHRVSGLFVVDPAHLPAFGLPAATGVPVIALHHGAAQVVSWLPDAGEAVAVIADRVCALGEDVNAAVGYAAPCAAPVAEALSAAVGGCGNVVELTRFRVGPALGGLTGPFAAGCFVYPALAG